MGSFSRQTGQNSQVSSVKMESTVQNNPQTQKPPPGGPHPDGPSTKTEKAKDAVPTFIRQLAEGQKETIDFNVPLGGKPPWLDEEKFKRGQKFALDHLSGVIYSEMLSLFMLFAFKPILGALVSTGRSSTPYGALRRYLGTAQKVISWYEEDIWGGGHAGINMAIVRALHKNAFHRLENMGEEEASRRTTLAEPRWSTSKDVLLLDFKEFCPGNAAHGYLEGRGKVWLSQSDMAITQFGFVGLAVTYPKRFGIYNTTEEELEDFVYMWRGLGYLLGIKDRYNFCNGDLPTVRQRSRDIIDGVVKPAFREIDTEWEHLSRCLVEGISLYAPRQSFEGCVLYLCHALEIDVPRFKRGVSYKNRFGFHLRRFFFFLNRVSFVRNYFNRGFRRELKKVGIFPGELLAGWEAVEFPYIRRFV